MINMFSIRMRASQQIRTKKSEVKSRNTKNAEIHISGAEGLYEASEIHRVVKSYIERALSHSKGKTDKIIVTIENIKQKPEEISTLPVATVSCNKPTDAKNIATKILQSIGISKRAIDTAFNSIKKGSMRGAVIITRQKGNRLEPDRGRGVRVSRLGIDKSDLKALSLKLSRHKINTDTVKEAIILASKVASSRHVVAELCISDDPYYTTGYIASKKFGYLRIPNIKHKGSKKGGRAFFVKEGINVKGIINYLEKLPVIITKVASCRGIISTDEILNFFNK
jgi:6-carboxyhexanoate--CoA ligase